MVEDSFEATKTEVNQEILKKVLCQMFGVSVTGASVLTKSLHGGTLGNVVLVSGEADISDGSKLPYKIVWKSQKKWARYGDADSWRREYDLYKANLDGIFSEALRWPKCYYAQFHEDEIQLWMEYIEGILGLELSVDMYEKAAEELGKLQGKLFTDNHTALQNISNLSAVNYPKNFYLHYRSWPEVYDYIRSDVCDIPEHLCKMLIDMDNHFEVLWERIEQLPVVLCHRDFWVANIFYDKGQIRLIDWDTAGWGYLGEDIASLIADEADVEQMDLIYSRCIPAYYKGFMTTSSMTVSLEEHCIKDFILILFGYRLIEGYKFADTQLEKEMHLKTLEKIYLMK